MDTEQKRTYEKKAKKILSNKRILAHILQRVVDELRDKSIEQIVCYMDGDIEMDKVALQPPNIIGDNTEDYITGEETVYFDLRFTLTKINGETKILFDLEAQNDYNPGYPLVTRGIVYTARMISNQINTEFTTKNYGSLKKIYSIWVCFNAPKRVGNAITKFSLHQENLLGEVPTKKEHYDKLCIVQICLQKDCAEHEDKLIRLLNVLFREKSPEKVGEILRTEYNIPVTGDFKKEVVDMCNLSEGIEREGVQKGIQTGIQKGFEQAVLSALQTNSPESVAKFMNIPLEQVQEIMEKYQ